MIKSESGVSELIGAILLVSLVVMLIMVVTTVIISQPRPEKIPELSATISTSYDTGMSTYLVNITHMGGDGLKPEEYLVVINGVTVTPIKIFEPGTDPWTLKNEWSFQSPNMVIKSANKPNIVELYYSGPSNRVLIAKADFQ